MPAKVYDYVVVGAGSAGCVLAARLSEDPAANVLLLEGGPLDTLPELKIPGAWPALFGSAVDYGYATVPQVHMNGVSRYVARGRTLGGSSATNAMLWIRGHRNDFDTWAAAGCAGWDYDSVLPYFQRLESVPGGDPAYRGTTGPMRPAPAATPHPLSTAFVAAAVAAGHPQTPDFNGGVQEGVGLHELNVVDGQRQSSADAFIHPIERQRPNLTVLTDARVTRLRIDGDRCHGLTYVTDGVVHDIEASREVVLSCGAIDTPRLLQLSGVGPAAVLEKAGVPVLHDLPGVGENLHEHPLCSVVFETRDQFPLGEGNHSEASLVFTSDPALSGPDMQLIFIDVPFHQPELSAPPNSYTIGVTAVPDSRGSLRVASADPAQPPVVDLNFLAAERDVERLARGIEVIRKIAAIGPLAGVTAREVLPGPDATDAAALREYVRRGTGCYNHASGSCAMGTSELSVVGPDLRVRGIAGLRIADASVLPNLPVVNPNAAVMMIGEKAADLITADWSAISATTSTAPSPATAVTTAAAATASSATL
jgi:choline dehydrogenase